MLEAPKRKLCHILFYPTIVMNKLMLKKSKKSIFFFLIRSSTKTLLPFDLHWKKYNHLCCIKTYNDHKQ